MWNLLVYLLCASNINNSHAQKLPFMQVPLHRRNDLDSELYTPRPRPISRHEQQRRRRTAITSSSTTTNNADYIEAPLHLGLGTHYAHLWIGTPTPQRQTLIVDTGSHLTSFPCAECEDCGQDHHIDPYFDPSLSDTFLKTTDCSQCATEASCAFRDTQDAMCVMSQSYTEGSSWNAYQSRDEVILGSDKPPTETRFAAPFTFYCQRSATGLFVSQLADGIMGLSAHPDTLLSSLVSQHVLTDHMATLCFASADPLNTHPEDLAGILTLGGIDTRLHDSQMLYGQLVLRGDTEADAESRRHPYGIPSRSDDSMDGGWYAVYVRDVILLEGSSTEEQYMESFLVPQAQTLNAVGKDHLKLSGLKGYDSFSVNSGKGVILDSGTTDTYLHDSLKPLFEQAWDSIMEESNNDAFKGYHNNPMTLTREQVLRFPTILIQLASAYVNVADDPIMEDSTTDLDHLSGATGSIDLAHPTDILLAIPPTHYLEYNSKKNTYTSRLYFTEGEGGVLGANALQGHDVLLDWTHRRVGIAKSSCSFDDLQDYESDIVSSAIEEQTSEDCVLGPASVVLSCKETLQHEIDSDCPGQPDKLLKGTEKWVRVVEADAGPTGKSCQVMAKSLWDQESLVGDDDVNFDVSCNPDGLCTEVRSCVLPCKTAADSQLKPLDATASNAVGGVSVLHDLCGDNLFGACQSSCQQTKVVSRLMNDGQCHASEEVETRDCHIDECAFDKCAVPFVVHAIFGFGSTVVDEQAKFWDKAHNEVFAHALAQAITDSQVHDYDNMDLGPGDVKVIMVRNWRDVSTSKVLGKKVSVEISIYNPSPHKCSEEDIYPFSHAALDVHNMFTQPEFLQLVLDITAQAGQQHADHSSFDVDYLSKPFDVIDPDQSQILSSWTQKTEAVSADNFDLLKTSKTLLTDPAVLSFGFAVVLFILSCGIYFGYKMEERRDDDIQRTLLDRIRVQSRGGAYRGNYAKISSNENEEEEVLEIQNEDQYYNGDDDPDQDMPTSFTRPYRDSNGNSSSRNPRTGQDDHHDDDVDDDVGDIEFA